MIRIFYKKAGVLEKVKNNPSVLDSLNPADVLWIDLQYPSEEERLYFENRFNIEFYTLQEASEIESSSRYVDAENYTLINSNFLINDEGTNTNCPVSFYLMENYLITMRNGDIKAFADTVRKMKQNNKLFNNGTQILISLFETRVDQDADLLENIARNISAISKRINLNADVKESILFEINTYQETTMIIRENIVDKQRAISSLLKSGEINEPEKETLRILVRDIRSLLEHAAFSFERLEYLQNTVLGLVNIEQNKIIKIFTVVSVIFMPPTLIASIYGMNFKYLPEIDWGLGYPFAIILMLCSSMITLYIFKKRNWL